MMMYEVFFKFIKMNKNKLLQKLKESLKAGKLTKEIFIKGLWIYIAYYLITQK